MTDGQAGEIAGRYAREREIGRGGTGVVWLGHDRVLGRRVALKRLGVLPGSDETDGARAAREADLSARLNHPHVVAVFDVVTDEETGDLWLVMEYVDGIDLDELVRRRGPLSPDEAAPLLRQVADALGAAHAVGVTHRDVKPSNILVDEHGDTKLTDFGIARLVSDPSLTRTGLMTGSPAYLAPEVASGGRGDRASDVWSLGATAFHLLAGRPPYDLRGNPFGTLYRIVNDPPPRLPDAGWMAPLLAGTMAKDPAHRWSIGQVRDFLDRCTSGAPADREDTQVLEPLEAAVPLVAPSWRPPGKVLAGAGGLAALVLVVVLTATLTGGGSTPPEQPSRSGDASGPVVPASARPTAQGIEAFIRQYVATVARDPDQAWTMLTPKFQRESGGLARYRAFWDAATNGRVLDIAADPAHLTVSYQVRFDHFDNGPGPTVLDLVFVNGRYFIDGERTKGFVPAE